VTRSERAADDPFASVEGLSLSDYVDVCRALIRRGSDTERRIEEVLAGYDIRQDRWTRIRAAWTERIRSHPGVRSEFRRLYAGPVDDLAGRNE
jgi:hypothetical protein